MTSARAARSPRGAFSLAVLLAGLALHIPSPAAPPPPAADAWQDPRLDKKVTLRLKRAPLSEVVAEIGKQTGAAITARAEVADEPAIVWVTAQPAAEVMRQLAALFGFRWARYLSGPRGPAGVERARYELFQDAAAKRSEEGRRSTDLQKALQYMLRRVRGEWKPGDYPLTPDAGARQTPLATFLPSLSGEQWDALLQGRTLHFSPGRGAAAPGVKLLPLPPESAQLFRESLRPRAHPGRPPEEYEERLRRFEAITANRPELRVSVWGEQLPDPSFDEVNVMLYVQPVTWSAGAAAWDETATHHTRLSPLGVYRWPPPEPPPVAESARRWAGDPLLGRRRTFTAPRPPARVVRLHGPDGARLSEFLPDLAAAYDVNLVADAYCLQSPPPAAPFPNDPRPLYQVLDTHVLPRAAWERQGQFIRVRSHLWHWQRLGDVPDRVVRFWTERLKQSHRLTAEDAGRLTATLSEEQCRGLWLALQRQGVLLEPNKMLFSTYVSRAERAMLGVYGRLSDRQRQALQAGRPVTYSQMSPEVRRGLSEALAVQERRPTAQVLTPDIRTAALWLNREDLRREVRPSQYERVRGVEFRYTTGPHAGDVAETDAFSVRDALPGRDQGGQLLQQATFTCTGATTRPVVLNLLLPWAYFPAGAPEQERPAERVPPP